MEVRVLYFGIVRERLGKRSEEFELAGPLTVADLMAHLTTLYPRLADGVASLRVAVNCEYVDVDSVLQDRDEVAIIPPVSGGSGV